MTKENEDLVNKRIEVLFDLIDQLITELRKDPSLGKQMVVNSRLNDFCLIRRGAK